MSRALRIQYPGAWYHVMNRGAGFRKVFETPQHRRLFLSLLGETVETFGLEIHAYCLMETHYHLLVCSPRGEISRAMRHLNGVYTVRYNRLQKTDGPLFRGRYKSILVDADSYLAQVSRYIHLNPVEGGLSRKASAYAWSSYGCYVGEHQAPDWLSRGPVLGLFGNRAPIQRYREFVESGVEEEIQEFYQRAYLGPVLGSESFRRRVKQRYRSGEPDREVAAVKRLVPPPSINRIRAETARQFGVTEAAIGESSRGRGMINLPRGVAIALSRMVGGYPLAAIAQQFGLGHYSSVTKAVRRLRDRAETDTRYSGQIAAIREELGNPDFGENG